MKYHLSDLSVLDLQLLLQARGLNTSGDRTDLINRLEKSFDAITSFTWQLRQLPRRGPTPYRSGGSLVYHADRLYLYGGFDENFHLHNDFWEGRIIGDQVIWSESNAGSINGGPQLRDHYAFVYQNSVWLYGGVRIGLQRNTSDHLYYFDIENMRWRSFLTRPANGDWIRPDNQTIPGTTAAAFHEEQKRLYAFGGQVQFELGHLGHRAAYLDLTSGIWHRLVLPEGVSEVKAACIYKNELYILDPSANIYVLKGTDILSFSWKKVEIRNIGVIGTIEALKLSSLLGSIWLIVWSSTPRGTTALQINLADLIMTKANIEPISSRREAVDVLSYTVIDNYIIVTGLLGSYFSSPHGLSESATFIMETCPGIVPEPKSMCLKTLEAINELRDNQENADISLYADDKEFKVHKCLLAAQSPYFKTMFQSGMIESISNKAVLNEMDPDVLNVILDFMYGRVVTVPSNIAISVFKASDQLQIPELTKLMVSILKSGIHTDNVANILRIAGEYSNDELWDACVTFSRMNTSNLLGILRSKEYLQLMEANSELSQRFQIDVLVINSPATTSTASSSEQQQQQQQQQQVAGRLMYGKDQVSKFESTS